MGSDFFADYSKSTGHLIGILIKQRKRHGKIQPCGKLLKLQPGQFFNAGKPLEEGTSCDTQLGIVFLIIGQQSTDRRMAAGQ